MRRTTIITVTLAATALLATACNSGTTGTGTTTTSEAATSSADLNGAPHVSNPLNVAKYETHQCSVLTSAQLQALHIGTDSKAETTDQALSGPSCVWSSISDTTATGATFVIATNGSGLSSLYAQRSSLPLFDVISDIDGYPAVIFGLADQRSQGTCSIAAGASDQVAIGFAVSINDPAQESASCSVAEQGLQQIIENIKNGG